LHFHNLNKKGIHEGSNILLFTAVEDHSLRIEAQSENETKADVMKTLREMYPNVNIPEPTGKADLVIGELSQKCIYIHIYYCTRKSKQVVPNLQQTLCNVVPRLLSSTDLSQLTNCSNNL
jgi:hypothetical protein